MEDKGFALQVSYKFGPGYSHMLNIRGEDPQDFAENCQMAEQMVTNLQQLGNLFAPATAPAATPPLSEKQVLNLLEEELGGKLVGKTCNHGEMIYKEGTGRGGKPYKAFFCPSNGPGKCQAVWL